MSGKAKRESPRVGLRVKAFFWLVALAVGVPINVLWHGLPVLWRDYPIVFRRIIKTIWTGTSGPYKGVVW